VLLIKRGTRRGKNPKENSSFPISERRRTRSEVKIFGEIFCAQGEGVIADWRTVERSTLEGRRTKGVKERVEV